MRDATERNDRVVMGGPTDRPLIAPMIERSAATPERNCPIENLSRNRSIDVISTGGDTSSARNLYFR